MAKEIEKKDSEVTSTQSFAGTIRKGSDGAKLVIRATNWYQHELAKFRDGEKVTLHITNHRQKRTLAQNAYWWVYMTLISSETGHTPEEIHEWAKGKFLTKKIVLVFGSPTRVKGSTAELSKSAFSELIENVRIETEIEPPPSENYDL